MLNRPTRPIAQPPSSSGETGMPNERHADALVGDVGRQVQADEGHMEAADEKADGQEPEAAVCQRPRCSASRARSALAAGPVSRRAAALLAQPERERDHGDRTERRGPAWSGASRPAASCRIDANGTMAN